MPRRVRVLGAQAGPRLEPPRVEGGGAAGRVAVERVGGEAHVHARPLPPLVLVDARDVAECRVDRRQVVVLEEVLDEDLPVGCGLVRLAVRRDQLARRLERRQVLVERHEDVAEPLAQRRRVVRQVEKRHPERRLHAHGVEAHALLVEVLDVVRAVLLAQPLGHRLAALVGVEGQRADEPPVESVPPAVVGA